MKSLKEKTIREEEKTIKEKAIKNFVRRNYSSIKCIKCKKKIVDWYLGRCIGVNERGFVGVLTEGEGVLIINQRGSIFDRDEI